MLAMASAVIVALSPEAMELLAPEKYADSLPAVLPLALSTIPSFVISHSSVVLISQGRQNAVSVTATVSVGIGIVLGFLLIPTLGYFGAGAAHLLSQIIGALIIILFLERCKVDSVIARRSLILSALSGAALAGAAYLWQGRLVLRGVIALCAISVIAAVLYRSRELIREK